MRTGKIYAGKGPLLAMSFRPDPEKVPPPPRKLVDWDADQKYPILITYDRHRFITNTNYISVTKERSLR